MFLKELRAHLMQLDWPLILSAVFLCVLGLISIYSTAIPKAEFSRFYKQLSLFGVGLVVMVIFSMFDWRILKNRSYFIMVIYLICLVLLGGLLLFGGTHRGIKGWYEMGMLYFNPIELLKLVLIIILAKYFSNRHAEMYNFGHVVMSGLYVAIPSVLIFLQPDIGSILVMASLWVGILLVSGIKPQHFMFLILIGALVAVFSWNFLLKDYQRSRIIAFANPDNVDKLKTGWNQEQMQIAIGSGGFFGKGVGKGSQVQLGFLPEPHTDFIFCAIAEEMGFAGVLAVLGSLLFLLSRIINISLRAPDNFARFFAAGVGITLFSQSLINLSMNLRLFPIVGIPLPFVSYGGGNLVFTFIALGILQSISLNEAS